MLKKTALFWNDGFPYTAYWLLSYPPLPHRGIYAYMCCWVVRALAHDGFGSLMELERDGMGRMGHTVTTTGGANNMTSIVEVTSECGMRLKYWKRRSTEELLWVEIHLKWGLREIYWGGREPLWVPLSCALSSFTLPRPRQTFPHQSPFLPAVHNQIYLTLTPRGNQIYARDRRKVNGLAEFCFVLR